MTNLDTQLEELSLEPVKNEQPGSIPSPLDTVTETLQGLTIQQPKRNGRVIRSAERFALKILWKALWRLCQSNPTAAVELFTRLTASNPDRALLTEPQRREFLAHLCAGGSIEDLAAGGYSLEQDCKAIFAVIATQDSGDRNILICRLFQTVQNLQRKQAKGPFDRF